MHYSLALLALAGIAAANPVNVKRDGVTALITPSAPPPPGCSPSGNPSLTYGIAINNVSTSAVQKRAQNVTQAPDGQVVGAMTMATAYMISDGQVQGGLHTVVFTPVAQQTSDGQVQVMAPSVPGAITSTAAPVSQATDAQPQVPISSAPAKSAAPVTSAAPATSAAPPPAAPPPPSAAPPPAAVSSPASSAPAQSAAPPPPPSSAVSSPASSAPASSAPSAPAASGSASSSSNVKLVSGSCYTSGDLGLILNNGALKDAAGRFGYIASNYQFQFDAGVPQAGAIYTSGFSFCDNGTLALGGSNIFYQCLSGSFYNLYDRHWAAQCSPVTISLLEFTC